MQKAYVLRGCLIGPRRVELEEAIEDIQGDVEVTLRAITKAEPPKRKDIVEVLWGLRGGTRTKKDIDAQIAQERFWGDE